jgi:inorganic triphosphatase YgiF
VKHKQPAARFKETELKLALPTSDASRLFECLAKTSTLAKRSAVHLNLHNIYFDSPSQHLRQARIALRLRRVDSDDHQEGHWLQTLKMGGQSDSALSQRGEWEVPVPGPQLSLQALQDTPWAEFDPSGEVFRSLSPCFTTRFKRVNWVVRRRDGTQLEVSLDLGDILVGAKSAPICELELELLAGQADALFGTAQALSQSLAVLPLNASKSERGYTLAQDEPVQATFARPPLLNADMNINTAAQKVLREMFGQFTGNLYRLLNTNAPEAVHQARIGWRRLKSSMRLFNPALNSQTRPSLKDLQDVLLHLGELRNINVARFDTLPALANLYIAGNDRRVKHLKTMSQTLEQAAQMELANVRAALQAPAVGTCLLLMTQWLENLSVPPQSDKTTMHLTESLASFAKRRTGRLHQQLQLICQLDEADNAHQIRLLAKRLRYNVESLRPLLPKKLGLAEHQLALQLQARLGAQRDVAQALHLLTQLGAAPELLAFMQGYSLGYSHASPASAAPPK